MKYGIPKEAADGRFYLKTTTSDNERVMVQLDDVTLNTTFSESNDLTFTLSKKSQDKVTHIDGQNIVAAKENCKEWFKKELGDKTLNAAYMNSLKEEGGTMNVSKATVKSKVVTKVFDCNKTLIEDIQEGSKCDVILEFSGIWFAKKNFGPIWRVAQLRMKAPPKKNYPDEYLFQEVEADESSGEEEDSDFF